MWLFFAFIIGIILVALMAMGPKSETTVTKSDMGGLAWMAIFVAIAVLLILLFAGGGN